MKILYITTIGTTMSFFKSFIKQLINEGDTVDIATNEKNSVVPEYYREWGCEVYQIETSRFPLDLGNIKAIKQIRTIVEKEKYDIVHCHTPIAAICTRLACRRVRKRGTKVFYTAHGFHFYKGAPLKNWLMYYPAEKICAHFTDVLITINKEDYALAKKKMKAKKVEYVPGVGVDLDKFGHVFVGKTEKRKEIGIPEDSTMLLSVGELSIRKNHKAVIQALQELPENFWYVIVGNGDLQEELRRLDHTGRLKLLGYRTDIADLLHASDVFVFPSLQEGLPVALMEAMASGVPVVCSSIRGNTDLVDDEHCLFNPVDVDGIRSAVEYARNNQEKLTVQNLEKIRAFDLSGVDGLVSEIYRGGYEHLKRLLRRQQKRRKIGVPIDATLLISVGELNKNKNHEVVIRAIVDLNVYYVVVGSGPLKEDLQEMINELGLCDRVSLLGYRSDVVELNEAADIFVFRSIREGLELAAIEGMAAGLPLVVSKNRGSDEYAFDGINAYVCKSDDINAFKKAIHNLDKAKERYMFGKVNFEMIKRFSSRSVNVEMQDIYEHALCLQGKSE